MSFEKVMEAIIELSYSQGFYGRLYHSIMELKENDYEVFEKFVEEIEAQDFNDVVDMVMYFEC